MIDDRSCLVYDANGNITQIQEIAPDNTVLETVTYTYDNQGQLLSAVSTVNGTWSYQYDTYGNIRGWSYGTDSAAYTYGDAVWKDLLTGLSVTRNGVTTTGSYVYDGSGNPTTYFSPGDLSTWTMTWKNGRELATVSNGAYTVTYDYDVNGLRTRKTVDGVRHDYIYASGKLLRETWTQSGTTYILDFIYDQAGRPYILNVTTTGSNAFGPTAYYYLLNLQGDVVGLVDADGNSAAIYSYDAWGNILTSSGSLASLNPLLYRGYYYDAEIGFYYLQSRYYDPALGRFINADGYASTGTGFLGYNMFAYCENGPVICADISGRRLVVIIYDANKKKPDGKDNTYNRKFAEQESRFYKEDTVVLIPVYTMDDFIKTWNMLDDIFEPGSIDELEILLHGDVDILGINGVGIGEKMSHDFSELSNIKCVKSISLLSCFGGRCTSKGECVAHRLAEKADCLVFAATASVWFTKIFGVYFYYTTWVVGEYVIYDKDGKVMTVSCCSS